MTAEHHAREALRLLALARESKDTTFEGHNPEADRTIAEAQVYATLALAAQAPAPAQLETASGVAYVYRAAWGRHALGMYTTLAAAREHCAADALKHSPEYEGWVFGWIADDSDPDVPHELVVGQDGAEETTDYMVSRVMVATEYDAEAGA
ncbi:hypothetical protein [Streptomyces alboflavus]|uniref:hypothetical protein n=1 Tax=Streptomyces alboflavus TaxID=67267 RepID=UPI0006910DD7|nr:hypothetical protein [Streptomyces alboflavus]